MMDLLGADLPACAAADGGAAPDGPGAEPASAPRASNGPGPGSERGGGNPVFAWSDGPLLSALKAGHWVLLDELNLAGQSVLEGLNALLDHRCAARLGGGAG